MSRYALTFYENHQLFCTSELYVNTVYQTIPANCKDVSIYFCGKSNLHYVFSLFSYTCRSTLARVDRVNKGTINIEFKTCPVELQLTNTCTTVWESVHSLLACVNRNYSTQVFNRKKYQMAVLM